MGRAPLTRRTEIQMDDNNRQISREEYIALRKIESLAQQNAQQSVRIADLETQISLLQMELNSKSQSPAEPQEMPQVDEVMVEEDEAVSH